MFLSIDSRTIQVNLAATTSASFDGSANVTPGVTGALAKANGGTGTTTGVTAVMNGSWYEERLAANYYRWTQIASLTTAITSARGSGYIGSGVALPAKPSGATITDVTVDASGSGVAVWAVPGGLANWSVDFQSFVQVSSQAYRVAVVAYGTKS